MNEQEFSGLLKLAIGANKSQNEFAKKAGITPEYLSRLIRHPGDFKPSVSTLKKIADASNGRIDLNRLEKACGYDLSQQEPIESLEAVGKYYHGIEEVREYKKGLLTFCGKATRYDSIDDILDTVEMLYGSTHFRTSIEDDAEYKGRGRFGAEKTANVTAEFFIDGYKCVFGFVIFFCETNKGGIVFSDAAFDLLTLNEFDHPVGGRKLMEISTIPNADRSLYQTVCIFEDCPLA